MDNEGGGSKGMDRIIEMIKKKNHVWEVAFTFELCINPFLSISAATSSWTLDAYSRGHKVLD